ncbi:hypothetical protein EG68_01262 [Paragonimus skrjabini miyazakii]|uniref:Potassium voltage-gated channel subfamily KQT member 5 n=1 Tax=Paragonimus skrjabini miyazakii TaxID=59628 RepID=A0A8S9Z271_9TREM|nr:hypothetical protein EG68_01262 [Paragonimus skrjabini miyazakii]
MEYRQITLCTVGYGDTVPKTWMGKMVAACCAVAGISFFALPAGILGSGFALKVQQHQREKHLIRRRVPAATLIQSLWRCYAADVNSTSIATWRVHAQALRSFAALRDRNERAGNRLTRFATARRLGLISPTLTDGATQSVMSRFASASFGPFRSNSNGQTTLPETPDIVPIDSFSSSQLQRSHMNISHTESNIPTYFPPQFHPSGNSDSDPAVAPISILSQTEKNAIRAIRNIKFFVARRKFREALRPYDVKDVIEQYSAGHLDMLGRIKILQTRLDQILGRTGIKNEYSPNTQVPLAARIVKIEQKISSIETKLDTLLDLHIKFNFPPFKNTSPPPSDSPTSEGYIQNPDSVSQNMETLTSNKTVVVSRKLGIFHTDHIRLFEKPLTEFPMGDFQPFGTMTPKSELYSSNARKSAIHKAHSLIFASNSHPHKTNCSHSLESVPLSPTFLENYSVESGTYVPLIEPVEMTTSGIFFPDNYISSPSETSSTQRNTSSESKVRIPLSPVKTMRITNKK